MENIDIPSLVTKRILPKVNAHIDYYRDSEQALRGARLERRLTASQELDLLLASRYASRNGKLHPAVDNLATLVTKPTEEVYLRSLVERALPLLLPPEEAGSPAVRVMAREIVTVVVLVPLMEMFGDPDFWNRLIDQFAGAAIQQQKLIHKVRHLLDTVPTPSVGLSYGMGRFGSAPNALRGPGGSTEYINPRTSNRQYESFLRSIARCDSLLDARRLKNDIVAEIRRTRSLIDAHPSDSSIVGESSENLEAFLERLYAAKRKVEKRITALGGSDESPIQSSRSPVSLPFTSSITLRETLTSQTFLSYFMEFMDRKQRSILVQFWLNVDTLKDPLGSADPLGLDAGDASDASGSPTTVEDIRLIYDLYFAAASAPEGSAKNFKPNPVIQAVSPRHVEAIKSFLSSVAADGGDPDTTKVVSSTKAQQAVMLAQKQVEDAMTDDFQEFKKSDLWFRGASEYHHQKQGSVHNSSINVDSEAPQIQPTATPNARRNSDTIATPRRPLLQTLMAPTRRAPSGNPRNHDTIRSRIFPTFILPSSSSDDPTTSLSEASSLSATRSGHSRPRLQSFGSDDAASTSSGAASPLSQSVDSLPPHPSLLGVNPTADVRNSRSALDFLTADPTVAEGTATVGSAARAPLFDDPEIIREETAQAERMEAIQAALTDLIADERKDGHSLFGSGDLDDRSSLENPLQPRTLSIRSGESGLNQLTIPSVSDRGHSRLPSGSGEGDIEEDSPVPMEAGRNPFVAGPGDLLLSHDIAILTEKLEKLESQDILLDALTRKAELTGDVNELRLLGRSKASLAKEIREISFQKTQYEEQEKDNRLIPARTRIAITSSLTTESEGKQVVRYSVQVRQLSDDQSKTLASWVVSRRYNEFFAMHQKLKEKYTSVRTLDFPGKRLVTSLSSSFVDTRKTALERYLQSLVLIPLACESEEVRVFLSRHTTFTESGNHVIPKPMALFPGHDIVRTMYRSVAESIDDMFFGPSMLDIMIQRLSRQAAEFAGIVGSGVNDEDLVANAVKSPDETLKKMPGDLRAMGGETGVSSFTAPICDLVLSVFELDQKKNWMRRQAVLVILQQVLGGTIERKLRETVKSLTDESHVLGYLKTFRDSLWPDGKFRGSSVPRTTEEKTRTKQDADKKLSALIPDLAANMIGSTNAKRGARRMFAVLQNRRLNQHIMYTIVDEVFETLFPEAAPSRG